MKLREGPQGENSLVWQTSYWYELCWQVPGCWHWQVSERLRWVWAAEYGCLLPGIWVHGLGLLWLLSDVDLLHFRGLILVLYLAYEAFVYILIGSLRVHTYHCSKAPSGNRLSCVKLCTIQGTWWTVRSKRVGWMHLSQLASVDAMSPSMQ